jgi:uncharacterized OB-fold protein
MSSATVDRIPLVDYLVLEPEPHLVAHECANCGARFFDRRNACANCSASIFRTVDLAREGKLRTFTIVTMAPAGVTVPFVAAVVDCDGTSVKGLLVNIDPDPAQITLGMPVRLTTFSQGTDSTGVDAIGYGFEPA